ncbi:hypothetical protein CEXT_15311 [Caerostris extrusa]|uniref:Uncharacterized protein n=1 Tax=Caerostris extrusa TaxID=172846 RepID=A0AAV4NCT7_CAEEX|nr:hypothetical protein CEXT_15311 [Caerostris extrusa]
MIGFMCIRTAQGWIAALTLIQEFIIIFSLSMFMLVNTLLSLTERSDHKPWFDLLQCVPVAPRSEAVASFRLATRDDSRAKYLFKIGISLTPCCPLIDSKDEMDSQHLFFCPALYPEGVCGRYWQTREWANAEFFSFLCFVLYALCILTAFACHWKNTFG